MADPKAPSATNEKNRDEISEQKPECISSSGGSPQPPMGSNIGGDSCSDADTQEPVKTPTKTNPECIEESDVEDFVPEKPAKVTSKTVEGKMRQIMEKVNAESDQSDEEDPLPADATVDFGDDEEVEVVEVTKVKKPSTPTKKAPTPVKSKKQDAPSSDKEKDEAPKERSEGGEDRASNEDAGKKKPSAKKEKNSGPAKTIKKSTEGKAKAKSAKAKAASAAKKKDTSSSPKAAPKKKQAPPKKEKTSQETEEKAEKQESSKATGKGAGKTEGGKARAKSTKTSAKQTEDVKPLKPKKVIGKEDKPLKKALVKKEDKSGAVKTFSKKASAANAKPASKAKKAATPKKIKSETKSKPKKVAKKTRVKEEKSSEEDDEEMVVADSEEEPSSDSSDVEMEEAARTPVSKLPILGNLACSSRDDNCTALLDHAVEQLGKYNVVSYGAESECSLSAYIIGKDTKRGWGLLQALALGVPLVSDEWLSTSISEGKWKPMNMYRSDRFGQSPRSVEGGATGNGRILDGVRVKVVCQGKDAASVKKALRLSGARVAETRMDVVINDTEKEVSGCKNVVKKWLADSIEAGMALDYGPYILGKE